MRARARTKVWVDWGFRACVDSRYGVCFLFSTELVNRAGSFLCSFWLLGLLLPCSCSRLFSERCAYFPGMWSPTTTVRCQANTPYAVWVHVETYNYSTLSSKYTLCSAGCMWTPTTTVRCQANTHYLFVGAPFTLLQLQTIF